MEITRNDYIAFVSGARYQDGKIEIDDEIIAEIKETPLVIFKQVFDPDFLNGLRETYANYDYRHHDFVVNDEGLIHNFSRWDDLLHREKRARKNMSYCLYDWNPDTPKTIKTVRAAVTRFGNRIAGRDEDERLSLDSELIGIMQGIYYPPTSCLMSHHYLDELRSDELFDEILVPFGTYGRDYFEGGLYVAPRDQLTENNDPSAYGELRFMEHDIAAGDIVAITLKDLYHRVEPIDPESDAPFDPMTGRFLLGFFYWSLIQLEALAANAGSEAAAKIASPGKN